MVHVFAKLKIGYPVGAIPTIVITFVDWFYADMDRGKNASFAQGLNAARELQEFLVVLMQCY